MMTLAETVTATSTGSATIGATITAGAETMLLLVVAVDQLLGTGPTTPAGWTTPANGTSPVYFYDEDNHRLRTYAYYKKNTTAGDVSVTFTATGATPVAMALHLSEITEADEIEFADTEVATDSGGTTTIGDGGLQSLVSHEGNVCVVSIGMVGDADYLSALSGWTEAAETEVSGTETWVLATHWKAMPQGLTSGIQYTTTSPVTGGTLRADTFNLDTPRFAGLGDF